MFRVCIKKEFFSKGSYYWSQYNIKYKVWTIFCKRFPLRRNSFRKRHSQVNSSATSVDLGFSLILKQDITKGTMGPRVGRFCLWNCLNNYNRPYTSFFLYSPFFVVFDTNSSLSRLTTWWTENKTRRVGCLKTWGLDTPQPSHPIPSFQYRQLQTLEHGSL